MLTIPMHEILRTRLAATGLNQTEFAARTGLRRRRVSKLLSGKAFLRPAEVSSLCRLFPLWARDLRRLAGLRPKPERKGGRGRKTLPGNVEVQRLVPAPRLHLVRQDAKTRKYWPGLKRSHPALAASLRARILARPDLPDALSHLERTRFDSKFELAFVAQQVAEGAVLAEMPLFRLGFTRHLPVDRETRELVGHRPKIAYLARRGAARVVLFPQVSLVVADGTMYTLDALVLVIQGRRRLWIDVEVDGSGHRTTWDRERAEALGLPEARFTEADVVADDFMDRFWKKVEGLLRG